MYYQFLKMNKAKEVFKALAIAAFFEIVYGRLLPPIESNDYKLRRN